MNNQEQIKQFALNPKGFMILTGKNGTHKTTIALKCYYRVTPYRLPSRDDDKAIFITQAELHARWKKDFSLEEELIDEMSHTKLFVLDDLGIRSPTDAFNEFLYAIVDRRWREREEKGTIITTNLNAREISERYGKPFFSRVASGIIITMEGEDERLKHHRNDLKAPSVNYNERRVLT